MLDQGLTPYKVFLSFFFFCINHTHNAKSFVVFLFYPRVCTYIYIVCLPECMATSGTGNRT